MKCTALQIKVAKCFEKLFPERIIYTTSISLQNIFFHFISPPSLWKQIQKQQIAKFGLTNPPGKRKITFLYSSGQHNRRL